MRRSGPLRRRTPLRSTGRKAEREAAAWQEARAEVARRGWCQAPAEHRRVVCGRHGPHDGAHAHHVWPEDRDSGLHDPERLLWLCPAAHAWTHDHPRQAAVYGLLRPDRAPAPVSHPRPEGMIDP